MSGSEFLKPEFAWIVIGLLLLILEFVTPGLVIGFFGAGALLVGVLCFLTELSLNVQIVAFLVASVGMLATLRSVLSSALSMDDSGAESEDAREVVGDRAKVIQAITPELGGRVEYRGSQWRAEAAEAIPPGETVAVLGRENLTLHVKTLGHA